MTLSGRCVHDVVSVVSSGNAARGEVVRRTEVVTDLMSERNLGNFQRDFGVVIQEGDDTGVQRSSNVFASSVVVLGVGFVFFTDTTRRPVYGSNPGKAESAVLKISERPDIREAEIVVVRQRVQI